MKQYSSIQAFNRCIEGLNALLSLARLAYDFPMCAELLLTLAFSYEMAKDYKNCVNTCNILLELNERIEDPAIQRESLHL